MDKTNVYQRKMAAILAAKFSGILKSECANISEFQLLLGINIYHKGALFEMFCA